jgi:hypothetical protein
MASIKISDLTDFPTPLGTDYIPIVDATVDVTKRVYLSNLGAALSGILTVAYGVPYLYLPLGWNTVWEAAKAASGVTPCWLVGMGDSTMVGSNTTDYMSMPWLERVRARLLASYGLYADYYPSNYSVSGDAGFTGTPPWVATLDGGTVSWTRLGLSGTQQFSHVGNPQIVFTTPAACTALDVYDWENFAGTWQFTVTGALAGASAAKVGTASGAVTVVDDEPTLTVSVTNTNLTGRTRRIHCTGLDNTTHVVTCNTQSGANVMSVNGCATFNPSASTGIGFARLGMNGRQTPVAGAPGSTADYKAFEGRTGIDGTHDMGFPSAASLVIIQFGINEMQNAVSVATFRDRLDGLVGSWRRYVADCSILLIASHASAPYLGDMTSGQFTNALTWPPYVAAMAACAEANTCGFGNIHYKWGSDAVARGFLDTDNAHPNDVGHRDIANLIWQVL